jgi:hypothetical protein
MRWNRRFFAFGLVVTLLAGTSCTTADSNPMEPVVQEPIAQPIAQPIAEPSQSLGSVVDGLGGVVGGVVDLTGNVLGGLLDITGLLSCQEQRYDVTYETIGPKGGTIKVGKHALVIPKGALRKNVRIKAEQMRGPTNSVRFSPEGLKFEKSATLILDYKNCQDVGTPKAIVYTTEEFDVLEVLRSWDLFKKRTVAAPIDHFSRYAVAY